MTTRAGSQEVTDVRERIRDLFKALNDHDVERIVAMHTPGAVWMDPTLGEPVSGRAAIADQAAAIFRSFPDLHFELDETRIYVADPEHAASSWRWVGTMTGPIDPPGFAPTGKRASVEGACVYELDHGLLSRHTIVFDAMGLLRQIGLLPALDSAPAKVTASLQRAGLRVSHALRRN